MTDVTPVTPVPTQTEHPARATARTIFAVIVALAAGAPFLVDASGLDASIGGIALILAVAAAITRILALPWTNQFLNDYLPWLGLAAAPKTGA